MALARARANSRRSGTRTVADRAAARAELVAKFAELRAKADSQDATDDQPKQLLGGSVRRTFWVSPDSPKPVSRRSRLGSKNDAEVGRPGLVRAVGGGCPDTGLGESGDDAPVRLAPCSGGV